MSNQQILILVILISTLLLALIKIVYINQTFPGEIDKRILSFHLFPRICRVIKFPIWYILAQTLTSTDLTIALSLVNVLDFIICYSSVVFIEVEIQSTQMFGSLNNLLSIGIFVFFQERPEFYFRLASELILIIGFFTLQNPLHKLLEAKYTLFFDKTQLNSINFHLEEQKKVLFLVFSCFDFIGEYQQMGKVKNKRNLESEFSQIFLRKVKKIYLMLVRSYFEENEDLVNSSQNNDVKNNENNNNLKKNKKICDVQQEQKRMVTRYRERYGKCIDNSYQMIEDRILFYDILSYCYNRFEEKQGQNMQWNYSNQFLVVFITKFDKHFIVKCLKRYQWSKIRNNKVFYLKKIRNQKWVQYIHYMKISMNKHKQQQQKLQQQLQQQFQQQFQQYLQQQLQQQYQQYLHCLQKLEIAKQLIKQVCAQEIKFIQTLINPIQNVFTLPQYLGQRSKNKNVVFQHFHLIFQNPNYLFSEQFSFIFLLFSIIFCKSVSKTNRIIQQKFRIAKMRMKFERRNGRLSKDVLKTKSLVVSCGLDSNDNKMGDVLISNMTFKKKFMLFRGNSNKSQHKISDLIFNPEQKVAHNQMMLQNNNFSKNQPGHNYKYKHESQRCFLRINLHEQKYSVWKEFKISTKVFLNLQENLSYICQIKETSANLYLLTEEIKSMVNRFNSLQVCINRKQQFIHTQLENSMSLIHVDHNLIRGCGLSFDYGENDSEYEMQEQHMNDLIEQNQVKFERIEDKIWHSKGPVIIIFIKYSFLCFIFFICAFTSSQLTMIYIKESANKSVSYIEQLDHLMSQPQGCQSQYSWSFYLMKKIAQNKLNSLSCQKYITNLTKFLRDETQKLSGQKINQYFKLTFSHEQVTVQSISPSLFNYLGINYTQLLTASSFDYSNYMTSLAVKADRYLITNLSTMKGASLAEFIQFIRVHSEAGEQSFSRKFINAVTQNNMQYLINNYERFETVFVVGTVLSIFFYILSIACIFKIFFKLFKSLSLLLKIPEHHLLQRIHEVKFISKQIENLSSYHFKDCTFPSNNRIIISTHNLQQNSKVQTTIEEFQKFGEEDFIDKHLTSQSQLKQIQRKEVSPTLQIITGNKTSIFFLLLFCLTNIVIALLMSFEYGEIIDNNFKMNEIIKEGGITKEALVLQQLSNWMKAFNDTQFYQMTKIKSNFQQASNYIKQHKFFVLFYKLLSSKQLNQTSYSSVCQILSQANMMSTSTCLQYLTSDFQYLRAPDLMSLLANSQERLFNRFLNGASLQQSLSAMCSDMSSVTNIVVPGVVSSWKILNNIINEKNFSEANRLSGLCLLLFCLFTMSLSIILWNNYSQGLKIRFEILTMDTPKDLYDNQNYRSDLNFMYQDNSQLL